MKRNIPSRLIAIALALVLTLIFAACGGGATYDNYAVSSAAPQRASYMSDETQAVAEAAGVSADYPLQNSETNTAAPIANRKIIKHVNLNMETQNFDEALSQMLQKIKEAGGYVESQRVDGGSIRNRNSYYERSANICARIPAEKLSDITAELGELCNITSQSENIDDITDSYFDVDARLKSLTLQEERLLDILSKAEKLEDVIELEKALSEARYEIESLTSQLRRMDGQVTYSYLNIYLNEVVEYSSIDPAPKTFGEKISAAFTRSGGKLANFFENAIYFVIEDLPLLIIWLVILGAVSFLGSKLISRIFGSKQGSVKTVHAANPPAANTGVENTGKDNAK